MGLFDVKKKRNDLKRFIFCLEDHERLFMGPFDVKNGNDHKRLIFCLEDHERLFMGLFDLTIWDKKQMQILDQSHGLTPYQK